MPMSRKDYKLIANSINDTRQTFVVGVLGDTPNRSESEVARSVLEWLTENISSELGRDNENFDEAWFHKACGF